jgi:signal transduction histidine kinase
MESHGPMRVAGERERRLERLIDTGRTLVSELDLEAVLKRVLDEARELTSARYAALGVLDEQGATLERFLTVGIDEEAHRSIGDLPRGRGVLGVLIREPRPLRLPDVGKHAKSYGFPLGHPPMKSFLGVPILVRGKPYGNLYLTEKEGGDEFDEQDEEAVVVLADWAAIAIENARGYSILEARREELERLVSTFDASSEIAHALAGGTDLDRILELVVKRGRALTDARSMLVLLEQGDELVVAALAGELDDSLVGHTIPIAETVAGQVLRSGAAERLADVPGRLRFALAEQTNAQSGLFVPLRVRGRSLGVLAAFDRLRDGPRFSAWDEQVLSGFAASAASAVASARDTAAQMLRRSIESAEQERGRWARELHDETLQELAALKMVLGPVRRANSDAARGELLDAAAQRIDLAIQALRRIIADLRPAVLDDLGLAPALETLVERVRASAPAELRINLVCELDWDRGRLRPQLEDVIYRVAQEALSNAIRHSGAARVDVSVRESDRGIVIVVSDDGAGFLIDGETSGFGLAGMRERVAFADGELEIETTPGGGTLVRVTLPAARAEAADEPSVADTG